MPAYIGTNVTEDHCYIVQAENLQDAKNILTEEAVDLDTIYPVTEPFILRYLTDVAGPEHGIHYDENNFLRLRGQQLQDIIDMASVMTKGATATTPVGLDLLVVRLVGNEFAIAAGTFQTIHELEEQHFRNWTGSTGLENGAIIRLEITDTGMEPADPPFGGDVDDLYSRIKDSGEDSKDKDDAWFLDTMESLENLDDECDDDPELAPIIEESFEIAQLVMASGSRKQRCALRVFSNQAFAELFNKEQGQHLVTSGIMQTVLHAPGVTVDDLAARAMEHESWSDLLKMCRTTALDVQLKILKAVLTDEEAIIIAYIEASPRIDASEEQRGITALRKAEVKYESLAVQELQNRTGRDEVIYYSNIGGTLNKDTNAMEQISLEVNYVDRWLFMRTYGLIERMNGHWASGILFADPESIVLGDNPENNARHLMEAVLKTQGFNGRVEHTVIGEGEADSFTGEIKLLHFVMND